MTYDEWKLAEPPEPEPERDDYYFEEQAAKEKEWS